MPKPFGGDADRSLVVARRDAQPQAPPAQAGKERLKLGDRNGEERGFGETIINARHEGLERYDGAGCDHTLGDLAGIAGGKQTVRYDGTSDRIHATGLKQPVGKPLIAPSRDESDLAVYRPPARIEIEKRAVLVEQDAGDLGFVVHRVPRGYFQLWLAPRGSSFALTESGLI